MQQMPFERVLVTGGTGFIGRYVTRRLVANGINPTLTEYGVTHGGFFRSPDVTVVDLDLRDHAETGKLIDDLRPELVIHLAGVTGQSDPKGNLCDEVNHRATVHLLDRLAKGGDVRVVMVGTAAEYGGGATPFREDLADDARSAYAISRVKANRYALALAKSTGLRIAILRLFSVYGIGQPRNMFLPQLIEHALSSREFLMTEGTQMRDFVHVHDVASALIAAAQNGQTEGVINIGSGVGHRLVDVARSVWRYCKSDETLLRIGAIEASGDGAFDTLADISLAERALNWRPREAFLTEAGPAESLVEMIEHMRASEGEKS